MFCTAEKIDEKNFKKTPFETKSFHWFEDWKKKKHGISKFHGFARRVSGYLKKPFLYS